jgi:hypothetical protein
MSKRINNNESGFTIAEVVVSVVILTIFSISVMSAYFVMVGSAATARLKSKGLSVGTEQIEYLRSLPYDNLAVEGGSINTSATKIPASKEVTVGSDTFKVETTIVYVDDAFDGCLTYPSAQSYLCRNGPAKSGLPVDSNPRDYKVADVVVKEKNSQKEISRVSTQIAARVAETGGATGAIIVVVVDSTGQVISGATVTISNSTVSPQVNQSVGTDVNGTALFLDATPDSGKDYVITATKSGYSSLTTIASSGSLLPTYPNISVLAQQVTSSTMLIDQVASDSLLVKVVDSNGTPRPGSQFSIRGGVKLYTSVVDQTYSYNQSAITTNSSGEYLFNNLTPGQYELCYSSSLCQSGRYAIALHSTFGSQSWQPFTVEPGITNQLGGTPMQTVTLYTSSSSSYPRLRSISPGSISATANNLDDVEIIINGTNLSGALVQLRQSGVDTTGATVGVDTGTSIRRAFNLSGKTGPFEVVVTGSGGIVTQNGLAPGTLGGFNVTP